jgi:anti-anti-sigma factor
VITARPVSLLSRRARSASGVTSSFRGRAVVLRARGAVDAGTITALREQIVFALVVSQRFSPLIVDLSEVDFLGSAGLALLAEIDDQCREDGRPFALVGRGRAVRRALRVGGLAEVLEVCADVDEALVSCDLQVERAAS